MDCGVLNSDVKLNFIAKMNVSKAFVCIFKTGIARCHQIGKILENKVGISITYRYFNSQNMYKTFLS